MAKIVLSDEAPKGKLRFSLANTEIEKLPHETDDSSVLLNAESHPWLAVEYDEVKELAEQGDPFPQVAPEDDALAAGNSKANDPDEIRKELERRKAQFASDPVAIEAGLDQDKVEVTASGVAETIAADNASDKVVENAAKKAQKEND